MACPICGGTGWVIVEQNGAEHAKPCECRKKVIAAQKAERNAPGRPVTPETAAVAVKLLCEALAFSPQAEPLQIIAAEELQRMVNTAEQLDQVVRTALRLYTKWPGIAGLRQIVCSICEPKDGIYSTWSEQFPDGLPAPQSDPAISAKQLPAPSFPTLSAPADEPVTDPASAATVKTEFDDGFNKLAAKSTMPRSTPLSASERRKKREFDLLLEAVLTPPAQRPPDPPPPSPPTPQVITAADCAEAVRLNHERESRQIASRCQRDGAESEQIQ